MLLSGDKMSEIKKFFEGDENPLRTTFQSWKQTRGLFATAASKSPVPAEQQTTISTLQEILLSILEENKRLRKDNYSISTKLRKLETSNFDEFFIYTTGRLRLKGHETITVRIPFTRESDFYATELRSTSKDVTLEIRDSSTDRSWSSQPFSMDYQLVLPKPRFILRTSTVTLEITNKLKAVTEVEISLIGYKMYIIEDLR